MTDSFAVRSVFNNGHAGIVGAAPYYDSVIEANPGEGVKAKYGAWTDRTGFHHVYQAGEISTTEVQGQKAAVWAGGKIGTPYKLERYRLNRRDVFYCSHLVYAAYKDTYGVDLDTTAWSGSIHPLELLSSPMEETTFEYVRE